MRKRLFGFVAAALCSIGIGRAASANPITTTLTLDTSVYTSAPGGEFRIKNTSLSLTPEAATVTTGTGGVYQTFCVEMTETFNPGSTYYVQTNTKSLNTNIALNSNAAYLFTQFASGTLANYSYTGTSARQTSANLLQQAIWYFQGDQNNLSADQIRCNTFIAQALAATASSWTGLGNVVILNLWKNSDGTGTVQDQLAITPASGGQSPGTPLPSSVAGGTVLLLGLVAYKALGRSRSSQLIA